MSLSGSALHGGLDRVRSRVPLPHPRVGRDADDDVREVPPASLAHPQAAELHARFEPGDRRARCLLRFHRHPVHEHVHIPVHEPTGGDQHERRDQERGDRIALQPPRPRQQKTEEHCRRARHVAREVQRVRGERRALVEARRPAGDRRPARVDGDDDEEDDERIPGRVDVRLGRADEHG